MDEKVEPSPELVSDEYDLDKTKSGGVYIFCAHKQLENFTKPIENIFSSCNYNIPQENINNVYTVDDVYNALVDSIYTNVSNKTHNFLILFFLGRVAKDGTDFILVDQTMPLTKIYKFFFEDVSSQMRDIPKILIFQGFTCLNATTECDSGKIPSLRYGKPPESDVLIAFKRYDEISQFRLFLTEFERNVKKFIGCKDIIKLMTHVTRPALFVSTLTKNLFLINNVNRNVEREIEECNKEILEKDELIKSELENFKCCKSQIKCKQLETRKSSRLEEQRANNSYSCDKKPKKPTGSTVPLPGEKRSRRMSQPSSPRAPWK